MNLGSVPVTAGPDKYHGKFTHADNARTLSGIVMRTSYSVCCFGACEVLHPRTPGFLLNTKIRVRMPSAAHPVSPLHLIQSSGITTISKEHACTPQGSDRVGDIFAGNIGALPCTGSKGVVVTNVCTRYQPQSPDKIRSHV